MSPSGAIRIVCLDLGGVLIRICRSWEEGCAAARLNIASRRSARPQDAGWYAPLEIIKLYQTGRIGCDEYARRIAAAFDDAFTPEEVMAVHDAWLLGEYEGVLEVIDRIHGAGLRTAALSNTNHAHWMRMSEFPAVMRLQHRFASHELGLHKPDPAIFREFQRLVNCPGEQILFFDDTPQNVHAARELGWNVVQIDPLSRTDTQITAALGRHVDFAASAPGASRTEPGHLTTRSPPL